MVGESSDDWYPVQKSKEISFRRTARDSFTIELVSPGKEEKLHNVLYEACSFAEKVKLVTEVYVSIILKAHYSLIQMIFF